ncbi:MAG TPA: ATP-binding protein, partial [Candidatus Omnitrophota bacterium]|nr:ATP-binding protein [Candidatus Omnitrophota bacterium]
ATLAMLAAGGQLSWLAALGGALVALALTAVAVWPVLRDLSAIAAWTRELAQGVDVGPPPPGREHLMDDMVSSVAQLRRAWQTRQAEIAARARWNESLFDTLPDPLVLLDEARRVVRVNLAAAREFGVDLAGRDLAGALRDPALLEAVDEVLAGVQSRQVDLTLPVPVERSFQVVIEHLGAGAPDGTVAILALHDVTTVRRMEQMRADFVANASHELRTPLATLLGFIDTLRGPARDDAEARDRFLDIMFEQGSRMARLINDLLSLSRIEMAEHDHPADPVDLGHVVERGAAALAPLAAAKNIEIRLDVADDARMVPGQQDELAQLVQNLMDNAVKYGRDGTSVEVTLTAARPGHVRLAVRDHGEGIAKEHLPRLTERFYRVDTARSRKLGGTGLGLAIVKHIVNRHRGQLAIDSTVGEGSEFAVTLPAAELRRKAG